MKLIMLQNI
ncbi:hypothetical protein LINGRAHAP2_LOCUS11521 [Linum grandiflorum]